MDDILRDLNNKQKEAVVMTDGPVLVIAGPGSGKTKVLTHRIAYLIGSKNINPENILAVTFTNKAAQEMKNRIKALLNKSVCLNSSRELENNRNLEFWGQDMSYRLPTISTFHSLCVRILRQEAENIGYKRDFVIYDDDDQISVVKGVMQELQINTQQFNPNSVLAHISSAKNELKTPEEYSNMADGYFQETVSKVYAVYQERLQKSGAFDFDDLIMQTILLFSGHPDILEKYQRKFKYVMVDEYQDTNHAQYMMVDFLSKFHRNLCVVGDDWQSIYKWRGADIRNILEFEKNYPEAKVILLEQNYRSTQTILDGSYNIISKNINRKDKKLWTEKISGHPIIVYEAADEKGEAEFIVSEIAKATKESNKNKIKLKDIAVLYRTNAQSRAIEEIFLQYGVPYKIVGGIKFYVRKEIKDIIAYLRLIQNTKDLISLERIINIPARGIGQATFEKIAEESKKTAKDAIEVIFDCQNSNIIKSKREKLRNFASIIKDCQNKIRETKTAEFLSYLINRINYKEYIKDGTEEGERRWENVRELFSAIEKYKELGAEEGIKMFLEEVALATDLDRTDDSEDSVTLMTLHSAKGLEFDTVFIIGLEEGLLPHSRSIQSHSEMEEERRLCYVGFICQNEKNIRINSG
jgi:DNA helicase-2/ATP-dependent DNA helicase PcrA